MFRYFRILFLKPFIICLFVLMVSGFSYATPFAEIKNRLEDFYVEREGLYIPEMKVKELSKLFNFYKYSVDEAKNTQEVPRIFVKFIPKDSDKIRDVEERKVLFVKMMLPLALKVNEEVANERKEFLPIYEKVEKKEILSKDEKDKLDALSKKYQAESRFKDDRKYGVIAKKLFTRIDVLPPSMIVAQAIEESGWGTSRFARFGNALFGEWSWNGKGMIPKGRKDGETYRVKTFDTVLDSLRSYMRNINSHNNYYQLRMRRKEARYRELLFSGYDFAGALYGYSQRGVEYVQSIRNIINRNNLTEFDAVRLK